MKRKLFVYLFLSILLMSFVVAQPPFETQTAEVDETINVFYPKFNYVPKDIGFNLHLHISNATSLIYDTGSCFIHIYDLSGNHICEQWLDKDSNGLEFETSISAGNFSQIGNHAWTIQCNTTNEIGSASGVFEVTTNGNEPPEGTEVIFFALLIIAICILMLASLLGIVYNMINWSLDGKDLTINISAYLGLFITYIFAETYLVNAFVDDLLETLISIGALTHVIVPIIGFVMFLFRSNLDKYRSNPNA